MTSGRGLIGRAAETTSLTARWVRSLMAYFFFFFSQSSNFFSRESNLGQLIGKTSISCKPPAQNGTMQFLIAKQAAQFGEIDRFQFTSVTHTHTLSNQRTATKWQTHTKTFKAINWYRKQAVHPHHSGSGCCNTVKRSVNSACCATCTSELNQRSWRDFVRADPAHKYKYFNW